MKLSDIEIGTIVNFLNEGGYVLDFSTADFDAFTYKSIGVPLCETYRLSKGKSLIAYINDAKYEDKMKLLSDLIRYYELSSMKEHDEENRKSRAVAYKKCRSILDKAGGTMVMTATAETLKEAFDSDYISAQIDLMLNLKDGNPTEAIGKAKELIESCCKTILEFEGCTVDKDWEVPRLVDETFKHFHLMPKNISDDVKGAKSIKAILGNLKAIAQGVAELRNLYGSGHGKSSSYKGLESRHASLAIGSSTTLVRFLWDSYERNAGDADVRISTDIIAPDGKIVARKDNSRKINHGQPFEQNFLINAPSLWSPETPYLYKAVSKIYVDGKQTDEYTTRFGIRSIEIIADKGFFLNGKHRKFQGVCNHHDLGPLGAAVNVAALRRQLTLLKDMGCDAVRTSHNMPTPELVELCDEMGFMMMLEPFDEWDIAKCENGYHRYFNEWAEKDMVNMLHHYRNNPCVVMWSIGNEVPTQCSPEGYKVASFLQDICHREDPTRPVTCGMDQVTCVLANGFAAMIDVPGLNYRAHRYVESYETLPQNIVLGSETASTVSSRGVYKFPVQKGASVMYDDHQCSGYDVECCSWSNLPDEDFALADDYDWTIGQFVWTGFDYLGEPSPYSTDSWPSHSSVFGIIDLASLPKDRFYLYRSLWNKQANTLHVLPHWTWPGREGENTPVFVYTSYPSAELFVNGKSYGKQRKLTADESRALEGQDSLALQRRYRLMWMDVPYEPGEVKVVAYDASGKPAEEKVIRTAGKPHHLELVADRTRLSADGKDLAYITVRVVDKDGNLCPADSRMVNFSVKGAGKYRAAANGDATSLDLFHLPKMPAFSGQLTAIVQSGEQAGEIVFEARAKGLKSGKLVLYTSEK